MQDAVIIPKKIKAVVAAIPSKSFSHRAVICASLSGGRCKVFPMIFSKDVTSTINAMRKIGASIVINKNYITINNFNYTKKNVVIDCQDSASTLRFLIPTVAALGLDAVFKRSLALSKRPILKLLESLKTSGITYKINSDSSIKISGKLCPGHFLLPGNISSQYISGLLVALPLLSSNSEIRLLSKLESSGYVDMTISVMQKFGVNIKKRLDGSFIINGNQKYKPLDYKIEGDWSQAAFFIALGATNGNITVKNLNKNSLQGDRQIFELLEKFGANIFWDGRDLKVRESKLSGVQIDACEIPDLVPVVSLLALNASGVTNIIKAKRLKFKESNRLDAIFLELKKLGANIKKTKDGLTIIGNKKLNSDITWSHNDHRVAMMLTMLATNLPEGLVIKDLECVKKSYPNFFKDYNLIGGGAYLFDVGK